MPQTKSQLPPEILEAVGDVAGAAAGFKRQLQKVERELTRDLLKGRAIDRAKSDRADSLREKVDAAEAKHEAAKEASKVAKRDVASLLKDAVNTHNPHGVVRRIMRAKIMPTDVGTLGELIKDAALGRIVKGLSGFEVPGSGKAGQAFANASVNDILQRKGTSKFWMGAAKAGGALEDLASDPAAMNRLFLANAAILFAVRKIDSYSEDAKRSSEALKHAATHNALFAQRNTFNTKFSADQMRDFLTKSRSAGSARRDLAIRGSFWESLYNAVGLRTSDADKEGVEREQEQRRLQLIARAIGNVPHADSGAMRRAVWVEFVKRVEGNSGSIGKMLNRAAFRLGNWATFGGKEAALMEKLEHEYTAKTYEKVVSEREDAMKERHRNPLYKNADMERTLQLRQVAEWKMERALQWNTL